MAPVAASDLKAFSPANLLADFGPRSDHHAAMMLELDGDVRAYYARVVGALAWHVAPSWNVRQGLGLPEEGMESDLFAELGYERGGTERGGDALKHLYQALIPADLRRARGEFYTPDWLADRVLDLVGYGDDPAIRLLDPACGSGTFLVQAVNRIRRAPGFSERPPEEQHRLLLANIAGVDNNPLAVLTARINLLLALGELRHHATPGTRLRVQLADTLTPRPRVGPFDLVVGNPPWINWADLSPKERQRAEVICTCYGLFPHSGYSQRLGGAMDDISTIMLYRCMDQFLLPGGKLGFVINGSAFHSEGGGKGFRRFRLGDGDHLKVRLVEDLGALQPFEDAVTRTALVVMERGLRTRYPVPYRRWARKEKGAHLPPEMPLDRVLEAVNLEKLTARPVLDSDPTSPWLVGNRRALHGAGRCTGASDYEGLGRYGVHTHCSGVYWVEVKRWSNSGVLVENLGRLGRPAVPVDEAEVEPGCLYPLLRGRDVSRWRATPAHHIILAQDPRRPARAMPERDLTRDFPRTRAYFDRHEQRLRRRSGFRQFFRPEVDPFYAVYNVGPYTFAPHKVVWREQAAVLTCAVIGSHQGRLVIPDHKLNLCPFDDPEEAHYLCAFLSSTPARYLVKAYALETSVATHLLKYLRIPRFDAALPDHRALAQASFQGHKAAARGDGEAEEKCLASMDAAVSNLWDLSPAEMDAMAAGQA